MTVGKIKNGLERGFAKHRLNCPLITDPKGQSAISTDESSMHKAPWLLNSTNTVLMSLIVLNI